MLLGHTQAEKTRVRLTIYFVQFKTSPNWGAHLDNVPDVCSNFVAVRPARFFSQSLGGMRFWFVRTS